MEEGCADTMRIVEIYSHLNGLEYLKVHLPELWDEIQSVINSLDAEACKTKVSKEKTKKGKILYSPTDMNIEFKKLLEGLGWEEAITTYYITRNAKLARATVQLSADEQKREIEEAGEVPMRAYNQTDFVKNRVALEIQFGKYPFVAYDLFVKHMAFFVGDKIDVGIEVLPMKTLQHQMSSGVACYEGAVSNVIRQGRGTPAVPLVIIGVEP